MTTGTFQRLIAVFEEAFAALRVRVSQKKIEDLATTVHRAMTSHGRHFHTMEHVFMFVNPRCPIQTLAGLYHDVVYYQVDMGFTPDIWNIIRSFIEFRDSEMYLIEEGDGIGKARLRMVLDVFDFHYGQQLSNVNDLNEFLSALVMNCELGSLLNEKDLLRLTLCVEATIPFRGKNRRGETHFEELEKRLRQISVWHNFAFADEEIEEAIKLAVVFANKDIENFGEADPGRFIDNTWKLLPEMNVALRARDAYSIREYRQALQKMENFLRSLNPSHVFNAYRGVPPEKEYQRMSRRAHINVEVACEYLQVKLLGLAILDALAQVTGGDAPLSLFVGDQPKSGQSNGAKRLEHFLPDRSVPDWIDTDSELYRLLCLQNNQSEGFDTRYAALSLFVYKSMPPQVLKAHRQLANQMFSNTISADYFLAQIDCPTLCAIATACAAMVPTRREKLQRYTTKLPCSHQRVI
ncbi:MAG: hypothetical protein ACOYYS_09245 [Chloroflexota bacterium]